MECVVIQIAPPPPVYRVEFTKEEAQAIYQELLTVTNKVPVHLHQLEQLRFCLFNNGIR